MFRPTPSMLTPEFKEWDGSYEKTAYDVELYDGRVYHHCWPNAGKMCTLDGSGLMFEKHQVKGIRFTLWPDKYQ